MKSSNYSERRRSKFFFMVFTDHGWFQIYEDSPGHMFASSSLGEKGRKRVVSSRLVGRHGAVRLDSMFKTVEFPASITDLNEKKTCLKKSYHLKEKSEKFTWAPAWPTWIDKHSRIFASFFFQISWKGVFSSTKRSFRSRRESTSE